MADGDQTSTVGKVSNAAVTLHQLAMTLLRTATDTLGWRDPRDQLTHDVTSSSFYATALHQYAGGQAMLTIFVTTKHAMPFDLRVNCEIAGVELVNAERIVHEPGVTDDEVREWLQRQVDRCLTALVRRVRGR